MTPDRISRFPLWAGLLIVSGLAPLRGATQPGVELTVRVDDGRISVTAYQVPVTAIVQEIAAQSGLRLVQHDVEHRLLTIQILEKELPDALEQILGRESYQLYRSVEEQYAAEADEAIPGVLWIFSEGSALAPVATLYLEAVLLEGDTNEKKQAIRELRRSGTTYAVQTLSLALGDEDARVRDAALEALAAIGGDEALAAIASAAVHDDPRLRGEATHALAMAGGYSSLKYLDLALHDANPLVRAAAIESLGDIGDEQSLRLIRQALEDPDASVRERALEVINEINDDAAFRALFPPE